jgi:UDP-N-acetyl-D-glucosamine dehydrogenase
MAVNPRFVALERKIKDRSARIGIVGLGYVGLPLAVEFAQVGFRVVGIDVDARKVRSVNGGVSHIEDVPTDKLKSLVGQGLIRANLMRTAATWTPS